MNNFADTSLVYFKNKEEDTLEALAFYEGSHIDSQGNAHTVTPDIIKSLAEKTNELLTQTDIPILTEHTKSPDNIRGVIKDTNSIVARPIDVNDVQRNPKLSSALGKLGLFISNIKLTDDKLLNNIKNGIGKAVSCGIDFKNSLIRELSLVSIGALPLASIFSNGTELTYLIADTKIKNNFNKANITNFNMETQETTAVTLEEALQDDGEKERIEAEAMQLLDTFLDVVDNIAAMSDEDLGNYQVGSKEELYQAQLETFMMMLDEKINPFAGMMDQQQQLDPRMQPQMQPQQAQYSFPLAITTFDEMDQYISEYGLGSMVKSGLGAIKSKVGGSLIGQAAKTAGSGLKSGFQAGKGIGKIKSAVGGAGSALKKSGLATKLTNKVQTGLNTGAKKLGVLGKPLAAVNRGVARTRAKAGFNSSSKLSKFMK